MSSIRVFPVLFLSLSFVALRAADTALPTVQEIAQKNTQARGGIDKIRAIHTLRLVGTARINGSIEGEITVEEKRPNLVRLDLDLPQGSLVQAFDGTDAWGSNPGGLPQKRSAEDSRALADSADIDGPLVDYKAKGRKVELVGVEDVAGSPAYRLKVTAKGGTVSNLWIDQRTWHEIKMTQVHTANGQEMEVENLFSNFKPVDGVMMPFTVEQRAGPIDMKEDFASAEVNKPIDDAAFRMPAAAPAK